MTETVTENAATNGTGPPEASGSDESEGLPMDRLKGAVGSLLSAATQKAVGAAVEKVDGLTDRLGDVAANGGVGLTSALGGGAAALQGGSPVGGALKAGASALKDKVGGALGNVIPGLGGGDGDDDESEESGSGSGGGSSGSGRGKFKFMNIFEVQDVGVPIRVAYDQWTQFADFPSFMKKVETVNQEEDEKVTWTAKVFWSRRSWQTTIREQVPDSHILWVSSGAKGHADGYVSFGELAPNMTRIILILEYYPQGFFEKTGNIWRAVGRRARLEFKHFCRHVMMDTLINREELEGWRGEIRDSEVVKTHEEAMEEEQAALEEGEDSDELADDEYDEYDDVDEGEEDVDDAELAEDDLDADDELDDEDELDDVEDEYEDDEEPEATDEIEDDADLDDDDVEDEYEYEDDDLEDTDDVEGELDDTDDTDEEEPRRERASRSRRRATASAR